MGPYRIALMETHATLRQALRKIIEEDGDLEIIVEAGTGDQLFDSLERSKPGPEMLILDLFAPTLQGIEGMRKLKLLHPKAKVLVLSMHENQEYLHHALSNGAEGYVLKSQANTELYPAIDKIRKGGIYISPLLCERLV